MQRTYRQLHVTVATVFDDSNVRSGRVGRRL